AEEDEQQEWDDRRDEQALAAAQGEDQLHSGLGEDGAGNGGGARQRPGPICAQSRSSRPVRLRKTSSRLRAAPPTRSSASRASRSRSHAARSANCWGLGATAAT